MIPQETVQEILETARIEEVVGDYVTLKKRGANMLGLCPFHNEKTPSFTVSPAKGIYKCFGCGEGGDSLKFVMSHEHYTYPEALRYLAKKYHIEVAEEEVSPEKQQALDEKESQYVVSAFAEKFFEEQLHETDEGKAIGLSYFKERGFTEETIRKFKLGYSPDKWDGFTKAALDKGYKMDYLLKTGLVKERNEQHYDGYRGRVIFPIHNLSGRPIGFGGRTLRKDKKTPKYVNSPECEIYNKRKVLYGLYQAKRSIVQEDACLLVEGYTDVISMAQAGIENVVSSSGTSLTTDQIKLINRYTKNVVILYDGDPAGIKASFRGIDLILEEGMQVKVVLFPEGEDPDSFAQNHDAEEVKEFIQGAAKDFIVFKTDLLLGETQGDPIKKTTLVHEIVESIALIPDFIARSVYLKECSSLLDVPEAALIAQLNKIRGDKVRKEGRKGPDQGPPPDLPPEFPPPPQPEQESRSKYLDLTALEFDMTRILLRYGDHTFNLQIENEEGEKEWINLLVADYIVQELIMDNIELSDPVNQAILDSFQKLREENLGWNEQTFVRHENPEIREASVNILSSRYELADWESREIFVQDEDQKLKQAVETAVHVYKARWVEIRIHENQQALKENPESFLEVMEHIKVLDQLKTKLYGTRGRAITR